MKKYGIWFPVMLALFCWMLIACIFAQAEDYYYCVVKTTLDANCKPILPCDIYSYVAFSNGKDVTYTRDKSYNGEEVVAVIAVKESDKKKLDKITIGDTFDTIKTSPTYLTHHPYTKEDLYTKVTDKGITIEYKELDKDDPYAFAVWTNSK